MKKQKSWFVRNIVYGNNNCGANIGYSAAPGWDPATGLGSPRFQRLKKYLMALQTPSPTRKPTTQPTSKPTYHPNQPTQPPTKLQRPLPTWSSIPTSPSSSSTKKSYTSSDSNNGLVVLGATLGVIGGVLMLIVVVGNYLVKRNQNQGIE
jgi:hypothetical protein